MRTRPAPLARLLDLSAPSKALLTTASTAAAFPLKQAERVAKKLRGAAESGIHRLRAVTGVVEKVSAARHSAPEVPTAVRPAPAPARPAPAPPTPPPPAPAPAVPPRAAERLLADTPKPATAGPAASALHRPGQDTFPIKNYDDLTAAEVVTAIRALERQADVDAVARYELAHRNRKSIATAAETRIGQLDRLDVRT